MNYKNISEEFLFVYGIQPMNCYMEMPCKRTEWLYKECLRNKILAYIQEGYRSVILPFNYKGAEIIIIKTY